MEIKARRRTSTRSASFDTTFDARRVHVWRARGNRGAVWSDRWTCIMFRSDAKRLRAVE